MKLNARQVAALYALRGSIKLHGELEVEQHEEIAGRWLRVEHPDGRCWLVSPDGATHVAAPAR